VTVLDLVADSVDHVGVVVFDIEGLDARPRPASAAGPAAPRACAAS